MSALFTSDELYALLNAKINRLDAEAIGETVQLYINDHPGIVLDLLGLYKDEEGYICQEVE